jgi:hypothetical protein
MVFKEERYLFRVCVGQQVGVGGAFLFEKLSEDKAVGACHRCLQSTDKSLHSTRERKLVGSEEDLAPFYFLTSHTLRRRSVPSFHSAR